VLFLYKVIHNVGAGKDYEESDRIIMHPSEFLYFRFFISFIMSMAYSVLANF
jgi:hypothetical protein